MRWLLCLFLLSCSGGGGSNGAVQVTTPAATVPPVPQTVQSYDWRDYTPLRGPSYQASGWKSVQTSPNTFNVFWGDTWEEQRISPNPADGGRLWVFVDAYAAPGIRYEVRVTKAELNRFDGKGWVDILPASDPAVYLPVDIGSAGVTTRQWGWIVLHGQTIKRFFWITVIKPVPSVINYCWNWDKNIDRPTLHIMEAWYDNGWTDRGSGPIDPLTNEPTGDNMTFVYTIDNALMINGHGGYMWVGGYPNGPNYCAQY